MPKKGAGSIAEIVTQFVEHLTSAIEVEALGRARDAVLAAVGGGGGGGVMATGGGRALGVRRGPGRPPGRPRKKPPIQYCPVPGCKNRAAPVFGMVCGDHRKVSKALIKKYRSQRKAEKAKGGKK